MLNRFLEIRVVELVMELSGGLLRPLVSGSGGDVTVSS